MTREDALQKIAELKRLYVDLDYSKPIMAARTIDSFDYILMPVRKNGSYEIIGYDWYNVETGRFISIKCWADAKDAVECYDKMGYNVKNVEVSFK